MTLIEFLHDTLTSNLMFFMWLIPFVLASICAYRKRSWLFVLAALVCVGPLIYYGWAMTGLWSTHIVALAGNRTGDISSIFALVLLIFGMAYYGTE